VKEVSFKVYVIENHYVLENILLLHGQRWHIVLHIK